jgi:hypothetical protein
MIFVEILSILIIIFTVIIYFNYDMHKNNKFMNFWPILVGFATFFFAYGTYISMLSNNEELLYKKNKFNQELLEQIFNYNIDLFMKYPELDYYYAQLYGFNYNKSYTRNIILENQISFLILNNMVKFIFTFNNNSFTNIEIIKNKFNIIIKKFLQSPIFLENYNLYKKNYGLDLFKTYMKDNFNL